MTHYTKAITLSILVVLLLVAVLPISAVMAEQTAVGFDGTSVLEDLQGAIILGKEFDSRDYNYNANGAPELLAFTEFAFSFLMDYQTQYGLYLYIYFPQGGLVASEELNQVNMAVEYNALGEPSKYVKFPLRLLNCDMEQVLYKFKVLDAEKYSIVDIYERVAEQSTVRKYDISSIELYRPTDDADAPDVVDYGIGGSWTITGYDKGMHASSMEESTLESVATFKNTLKLDVHSTYFRSWRNADNTLADQLSSVYFSVPNSIDSEYDQLYAINFEAYKYLSSPIFCIYDKPIPGYLGVDVEQIYKNLLNQRGKTSAEVVKMSEYTWLEWDKHYTGEIYFDFGYYAYQPGADPKTNLDQLAWVFQAQSELDYKISSVELLNYMSEFSNKFGGNVREKYNSLLFSDHYYFRELDYRTVENGLNIGREITATEGFELVGSLSQHNFWQKLSLLFKTYDDKVTPFCPIQKVTYSEIESLTDEDISQQFLVVESDVPDFKAYVKQQNLVNKSVYLFRFDVGTYYTSPLFAEVWGECGYVVQEPIYLDFDIISLTYDKAGVKTVIPVVSDPIDIIAGIEPPTDGFELEIKDLFSNLLTNFLTSLFGVIAIILFMFVVFNFLRYIFKKK